MRFAVYRTRKQWALFILHTKSRLNIYEMLILSLDSLIKVSSLTSQINFRSLVHWKIDNNRRFISNFLNVINDFFFFTQIQIFQDNLLNPLLANNSIRCKMGTLVRKRFINIFFKSPFVENHIVLSLSQKAFLTF